jgi:hypothetical protein
LPVADVGADGVDLAARCGDLPFGRRKAVLVAGEEDESGSLAGEQVGDREPDAARSPGDEDPLPLWLAASPRVEPGPSSTIRFSRESASAFRNRSAASATRLAATRAERRSPGCSVRVTSVPPARSRSSIWMWAVPSGRAFACSSIRRGGSTDTTSVWSERVSGRRPTRCLNRAPGEGKSSSCATT